MWDEREIGVPRDRDAASHGDCRSAAQRLSGVTGLYDLAGGRALTVGGMQPHLAEVYSAEAFRTLSPRSLAGCWKGRLNGSHSCRSPAQRHDDTLAENPLSPRPRSIRAERTFREHVSVFTAQPPSPLPAKAAKQAN
jgi:hypothetical protein